ncbi:siderophore-interacting protein [Aeromicrobium stalagmiti]|uniref:siderophore-interacting protein n=1 Tax=Aeromicrobium stalagmiti TaxID=2738988 RepID=UPI00156A4291|nr:siderophore-interacting protein [Aeromicrobium stalagmiti]NRQ51260.1 siderophore-interacting protein [Aeromicrobium stalagmiti]
MSKNLPARLTVVRTETVAPTLLRVVLGGDGFADFLANHDAMREPFTDEYVKLVFLADGFDYPDPLDLDVVKETMPQEAWPVLRTYTVRWVDTDEQQLAIDFVVHGDEGVAGPWAAAAQPGDVIHLRGPNGGYRPDPSADWVLFVGDEAGLPAIAASVHSLPAGARAVAFVEVHGPDDEIPLRTDADLDVHWLHRGDAAPGTTTLLDDAVRAWSWPQGRVQAFIHGESALLKSVRPYALNERGVARGDLSVSAYWRRGATEEGFRVWKSQQTEAVMRPGAS